MTEVKKNVKQNKKTIRSSDENQTPHSLCDNRAERLQPNSEQQVYLEAMMLWHAGEWQALAELNIVNLKKHPQFIELTSIKVVANCQLGNMNEASKLLKTLPHKNKNAICILISGVFNSLARSRVTLDHMQNAKKHFEQAAITASFTQNQILTQARWIQQLSQLGISTEETTFSVKTINKIALGDAWAGNTVNTVIFRHHGIFTRNGWQYTTFYVDQHTLRVVQRNLNNGEMLQSDIKGDYNIKDAHNSISLGMDRDGYLHISYDHHGTQLKYRRSLAPECIANWSDELAMTGQRETKVTYPAFLMPSENAPLQLLYRDGNHQKGSAFIKQYSEAEQCWQDSDTAILSGSTNSPWTSNAYWNHPVRDDNGTLHLSFVWRTHSIGEEQQINNLNVCYAQSFDNGQSWHSSNLKPFQLPITQVNAEVVWPISPASNLINQCSMAVDSRNRPHIVFYANDENDIVQYQHLWFDGSKWQHQTISNRISGFDLCGGGTLRIPISRPDIIIDKQDNVFVIYRGDLTGDCMAALCLKAPNYTYYPANQKILHPEPLGLTEPVIDRLRWQQQQVLSLLLQHNDQPNHDIGHANVVKPICILDVEFNA
ncbi:BNR repeat-containing protein [Oceanimonas smirnovii]|uniref:BNR repeat-containing protein n=1 Tax=Oceanimonas smirnovii TaxID=264574 RepID=UPI00037AF4CE|nr:BNR repeat-containing protein [Oceanimonas smirnovii]